MIRVSEWPGPAAEWDAFVRSAADGTVMHLYSWKGVMERAYGHRTHFLAAFDQDRLCGVLPLTLVKSPFLGASLVSMPFMDYGGACVDGGAAAERALVEAAVELARREGAELVLRYLRQPELDLPCSTDKATLLLDLGGDEQKLWVGLPSERRNRVRKGRKRGLEATFHGADGLRDFYGVFATNMRDLGSPVHDARFFAEVLSHLGEAARIVLVRHGGTPVGAGLMLIHRGMISIPWVSSLRTWFDACPNQVLYWEAMVFGIAHGHRVLDFGRSSWGSSGFEAKRQWGARPAQLYWHHSRVGQDRVAGRTSTHSGRRWLLGVPEGWPLRGGDFDWPVKLWKRLPLGMANAVGPWLRRGIPN